MMASLNNLGSVWAVVVTYNRRELLKGCLCTLALQSHPLAGIILVDNASEDETGNYLLENSVISGVTAGELATAGTHEVMFNPAPSMLLVYVRLARNEGGAGGFHEGISQAMQRDAAWIWMVDDDVEPEQNCLQQLLVWEGSSKCLHPRRRLPDGSFYNWEGYVDVLTGNDVLLGDISFQNGKEICFVNLGCFEGMLIHRDIVGKIGLPDKRFFIVYDDTMYGFAASHHTNVAYVRDAELRKMLPLPKEQFTDRFIYYSMRNYFLRLEYLDRYYSRSLYRIARRLNMLAVFFRYLCYILCVKQSKFPSLLLLFSGMRDGLSGRFGALKPIGRKN